MPTDSMIGGCDKLTDDGYCELLFEGEGEPPESAKCLLIRGQKCVKKLEAPAAE